MSIYFRWGGAALIMICALLIDREYKQYLNRRISENCGFLSLVSHAEAKISKFLCHGDGLWRDFSDDALTKCGFLPALQSGVSVADSFEQCSSKTALSKEAKEHPDVVLLDVLLEVLVLLQLHNLLDVVADVRRVHRQRPVDVALVLCLDA